MTLKEHVTGLILQSTSLTEAEDVHALCHALEVLTQLEHMEIAIRGVKLDEPDFPSHLE